jgi:hypothetical protein
LRDWGVGRSAYLLQRSRPSVWTARRSSNPTPCTAASCDRLRGVVADPPGTSLVDSPAPSGYFNRLPTAGTLRARPGTSPRHPRNRRPATLLSFPALQRLRNRGSARSRGLPPPPRSDLGVSHALVGLLPPEPLGSISTRNALGLRPSGFFSSRRVAASLEAPFLSCRSPQLRTTLQQPELRLGFRVFSPGVRASNPKCYPRTRAVTLMAFFPSKALRLAVTESASRLFLSCTSLRRLERRKRGCFRVFTTASPAFPSREDAGPSGVLITSSWRPGLAVQRACR